MTKIAFDERMSFGVSIGKDRLHLVDFDPWGQGVLRQKVKRLALNWSF